MMKAKLTADFGSSVLQRKKIMQVSQFYIAAQAEKVSLSPDRQAGLCVSDGHCLTHNSCQSKTINRFPAMY